jgi:hypothetical protein
VKPSGNQNRAAVRAQPSVDEEQLL